MEQQLMIEELQDMFGLTKTRAAWVLEAAVKYPVMIGKFGNYKTAYSAFVAGYEAEDDATFNAWKNVVEAIIAQLGSLQKEIAQWETERERVRATNSFNRSVNELWKLCRELQLT